jgi:hypothetical protein
LAAAIQEARTDPDVRNPVAVGTHRYNLDSDHYDRLAAHINCRRCHGKGKVFPPYAPGATGRKLIRCPGKEA